MSRISCTFEQRSGVEQVRCRPGSYSAPETPSCSQEWLSHSAGWVGESFRSRWSHCERDSHFSRNSSPRRAVGGWGIVPTATRRRPALSRATIDNFTRSVWHRIRQARRLDGQREVERNNSCRDAAMSTAKLLATFTRAVAALRSAPGGPANGEGAKLRGQGPCAEAGAARRLPACEARDAGGVTPRKLR
jgi:hypothetical protein